LVTIGAIIGSAGAAVRPLALLSQLAAKMRYFFGQRRFNRFTPPDPSYGHIGRRGSEMRCFCSSRGGKDGYVFCPDVATISTCHRYNYRSFRQESRTSTQRSPLRNGMERCTTLTAICRCLSTRKALFRLSGFLVLNWSSMAMRLRPRFAGIRGAAGHRQTLREVLPEGRSGGFFCACQEALSQQID
jgi:hypothetical protein